MVDSGAVPLNVDGLIVLSSTLSIDKNLTITGLGAANLAIDGDHSEGVFAISSGVTATISNARPSSPARWCASGA